ncbi:MAG: GtrA family protein [Pseudomonadota bacterium]
MKNLRREVFRFAIVGGLAFLIDAGLVTLLFKGFEVDPFYARLVAIGAATFFAIYWHRRWTFAHSKESSILYQQFTYVVTQVISHTLNIGIYLSLIEHDVFWQTWPFLAVAVGSFFAVIVTFCLSKWIVFRSPTTSK